MATEAVDIKCRRSFLAGWLTKQSLDGSFVQGADRELLLLHLLKPGFPTEK